MDRQKPSENISATARDILGFLNFSSGSPDPRFLENLSKLFGWVANGLSEKKPVWQALGEDRKSVV